MNKLVGIQWGRAAAAILVVVCHAIAAPMAAAPDFAHLVGRSGVTLFFVISGFIMVTTTNKGDGRFDPLIFLRKRLVRIVPLYYVATFVVLFLSLTVPSIFKNTPFDFWHVFRSLLFIPTYTPDTHEIEPFYKLGWTLNYEMFFYVVFASLFWMTTRARTAAISVIFAGLFVLGLIVSFENPAYQLYTRTDVLAFAAGAIVATAKLENGWRLSPAVRTGLLCGAALLFAGLLPAYAEIRTTPFTQIVVTIACTSIVSVLAFYETADDRMSNLLVLVGDASYAIYLFHMFAVGGTWWIVRKAFEDISPAIYLLTVCIASLESVVLGLAIHLCFEKPITRLMQVRPAPRLSDRPA